MPGSFRARLTLSYAVLTATLLTAVLCALMSVALQRSIRSTMHAVDDATSATREIVRSRWSESDAAIARAVMQQSPPAGVQIAVRRKRPSGVAALPAGNTGESLRPFLPDRSLGSLFGLKSRTIWLHKGDVLIAPDVAIEDLLQVYLAALGVAVATTMVVSWMIGRGITQQALSPLTTVTEQLRRFANGDFVPSVLETGDRTELGELIDAYNGAAAQVVAAFSEREQNEQDLRLFLGEAGHEMRTPLTVISAYLEMVDVAGRGDRRMPSGTLQTVRGEMRRLRTLVERVMELARMEGSDRSCAELIDVVSVAEDAIAQATSLGGKVWLRVPAVDVIVFAESWELQEAIRNLVDNAVRYGAGTAVQVAIEAAGGNVIVRVSNGGPGISDEDRPHIFRRFFRGERAAGTTGSGLGLAIVARAAERLGGQIELEHAGPPRRTTFRLTLPAYRAHRKEGRIVRVG
jgi:signal transduction histidine kinase